MISLKSFDHTEYLIPPTKFRHRHLVDHEMVAGTRPSEIFFFEAQKMEAGYISLGTVLCIKWNDYFRFTYKDTTIFLSDTEKRTN